MQGKEKRLKIIMGPAHTALPSKIYHDNKMLRENKLTIIIYFE